MNRRHIKPRPQLENLKAAPPRLCGQELARYRDRKVELQEGADALVTVSGLAARWDQDIERMFYTLRLRRGCFNDAVQDPMIVTILGYHMDNQPIGKVVSLQDRDDGLFMEAAINTEVQTGAEIVSNLRQGIATGLSVGFSFVKTEEDLENDIVTLIEGRLFEISVVPFPAIEGARVDGVDLSKQVSGDGLEHLRAIRDVLAA